MILKRPKKSVKYSPGMKKSHCGPTRDWPMGDCKHFRPPNACTRVWGHIEPKFWCRLFEAKQ